MAHHGLKLGTVTVKLAISLKDTIPEVEMPSYLSSVSDFKVMMPSYFSFVKEFLTLMKKVSKSPRETYTAALHRCQVRQSVP